MKLLLFVAISCLALHNGKAFKINSGHLIVENSSRSLEISINSRRTTSYGWAGYSVLKDKTKGIKTAGKSGAPRTAVYKFVRCNPEGDQTNCVTHQSPEMTWSPELPAKLPASTAQYLEAEPVEDEKPDREGEEVEGEEVEGEEVEEEEEETPLLGEEGESPVVYLQEDGSGGYEGSAAGEFFMADKAIEAGSGASSTEKFFELQRGESKGMRQLFPSRFLVGDEKPEEQDLKEDYLLQL